MMLNAIVKNRLGAYQRQAKLFRTASTTKKTVHSKTLISLIALATMGMLPFVTNAQCTPNTFNNVMVSASVNECIQDLYVDLNGDNTFDIRLEADVEGVRLQALNANISFIGNDYLNSPLQPILSNLSYGESVSDANEFVSPVSSYILSSNDGMGEFFSASETVPVNGFIGFKMGSEFGFLELSVSKLNNKSEQSSCIAIGDFGVSTSGGNRVEAGVCASLPVELLQFDVTVQETHVLLDWNTSSEIENVGFELERSLDGDTFSKIAWITGNSTNIDGHSYQYKDENIKAGETYFYRLKQMDNDGSFMYSEIVSATYAPKPLRNEVAVFPNPAQAYIQMRIESLAGSTAMIQLFTHTATLVHSVEGIPLQKGTNHMGLSALELSPGTYFLKVMIGQQVFYKRVVVV